MMARVVSRKPQGVDLQSWGGTVSTHLDVMRWRFGYHTTGFVKIFPNEGWKWKPPLKFRKGLMHAEQASLARAFWEYYDIDPADHIQDQKGEDVATNGPAYLRSLI